MLTKTELKQLEDLVAKAQGVIGKEQEWPQTGQLVFVLHADGDIEEIEYSFTDGYTRGALKQGNLFRTKEAAERERDRRALLSKLWRESTAPKLQAQRASGDTFVPDWNNSEQGKYYLYYDNEDKEWRVGHMYKLQSIFDRPYYATPEEARAVIDNNNLDVLLGGRG